MIEKGSNGQIESPIKQWPPAARKKERKKKSVRRVETSLLSLALKKTHCISSHVFSPFCIVTIYFLSTTSVPHTNAPFVLKISSNQGTSPSMLVPHPSPSTDTNENHNVFYF